MRDASLIQSPANFLSTPVHSMGFVQRMRRKGFHVCCCWPRVESEYTDILADQYATSTRAKLSYSVISLADSRISPRSAELILKIATQLYNSNLWQMLFTMWAKLNATVNCFSKIQTYNDQKTFLTSFYSQADRSGMTCRTPYTMEVINSPNSPKLLKMPLNLFCGFPV